VTTIFFQLAELHPIAFGLTLVALLVIGLCGLVVGGSKCLEQRRRSDQAVAREARLRATWERRARAIGLHPRDDETTDDLMDRVMAARAVGPAIHDDPHASASPGR
jgi:hypothetical protein